MKKLRYLLLLLLSVCMLGALAACGGGETYTVTFETYGGTAIEPYELKEGEEIKRPADPQKTLFTFAGWYADEAYTQEFNFAQKMPKNNLTAYARWTSQKSSRIVYDSMGGTAVPSSVGAVGSRLTMPEAPTKEGYTFGGWYTSSACNDNEYFSFTVYPAENLTLYARWDDDSSNYAYITYYGNDDAEPLARIPVKKGTAIKDPTADLFPATGELVCTGWYTNTALTTAYPFGANATNNLNLYTSFYTKGLTFASGSVTGYTGISSTVIVPNVSEQYPILSVGASAFRDNNTVTQIDLPQSVVSVGAQAFYRCRYLVSVNLSKRVTSVGEYAFFDCSRLTSYGDISNVTSIPEGLFLGCKKLPAITLSEDVGSVGAQAFADCELIKEMTLPAGVETIENGLFDGCTSLEKVTVNGNLTAFGTNVFSGCTALSSVSIPNSGNYSVSGRDLYHNNTTRGTELVFHIGGGETETEYSLPENVATIKAGAFEGNTALKIVTVGASVRLECGALKGMSALETLTVPALSDVNNYLAYYFGATEREVGARRSGYIPATLRTVTFVGGTSTAVGNSAFCGAVGLEEISGLGDVTSIGTYAFAYTALKSFTISPQLLSIGDYAFTGCPQFEEYKTTGTGSSVYSVYEGCLYNAAGTTLLAVPSAKTEIKFHGGVTTIAGGAFTDSAVEEVVVPDSITTLELGAFSNSFALRSLSVPFIGGSEAENNYMAYIFGTQISYEQEETDDGTAYKNASILNMGGVPSTLNRLTVRKAYPVIPDGAFALFTGLAEVNFPEGNTITGFGAYSFFNTAIEEIDLSHATSIGDYAFRQTSLTEVDLPALTEFGVGAFAMISSLESIKLASGITSIPTQAFAAYAAITDLGTGATTAYTSRVNREIVIPATVRKIGAQAFEGVGMLHDGTVNVPNARFAVTFAVTAEGTSALTEIGASAFSHTGLRTVAIPASVTTVGEEAFCGCTALETVGFGSAEHTSALATLGALSFSECTSLKTVTIYASQLVEMALDTSDDRNIFYDASEDYTVTIVATDDIFGLFQADPNWSNLGTTSDGDPRLIHETAE